MRASKGILDQKGFTMMELLVALLITGMLMAMIISVFLMAQKVYTRGGDISYKQKSITNVETDLQNALARSMSVVVSENPNGDYNLGFDGSGQCLEKIGASGESYVVDQITEITLWTEQKKLYYELVPKNAMSTLSGGIVMNNRDNAHFVLDSRLNTSSASKVSMQSIKPNYLVITYATKN